ncbi:hypothetical protein [Moraxella equi]|uniref:Uncharacterized protein n=1 Tax=Moraxella equi TaxID=60442 RepID=A0A378QUR4_9GAMM|nr:hypothetical protein [Moraxella equi]OPH40067.1 hypothetical protein B5J93_00890 [Moraxella equi]STZ04548.1 Uncharacterised protein [Moraxella equi]
MTNNSTNAQVATLLHYLQEPPKGNAFYSFIAPISFDYEEQSIGQIADFLDDLSKKYDFDSLSTKKTFRLLSLTLTAYLGEYLARRTHEKITWFTYEEAQIAIEDRNQSYGTKVALKPVFENSLIAQIGEHVFCQPLLALKDHLSQKSHLSVFINSMVETIFKSQDVSIQLEPNYVAFLYLSRLKNKKLIDETFAFYGEIKQINFDYSFQSIINLDALLAGIKRKYQLNHKNYKEYVERHDFEMLLYLLNFYVGATFAKLYKSTLSWLNYEQIKDQLPPGLPRRIEYQFIANFNDVHHAIMMVINGILFDIETEYPSSLVAFYELIKLSAPAMVVQKRDDRNHSLIKKMPKPWQSAFKVVGTMLARALLSIYQGQPVVSSCFKYDATLKKSDFMDITDANPLVWLAGSLQTNPDNSPCMVGVCDVLVVTDMGKTDGLMVHAKLYHKPALDLKLFMPYRVKRQIGDFGFFPINFYEEELPEILKSQPHLVATISLAIYESLEAELNQAVPNLYQTAFVNENDFFANTAKEQPLVVLSDKVSLSLLPLYTPKEMAKKEEERSYINAFDIIKRLAPNQREYLQVIAPDWLLKDVLGTQLNYMPTLYKQGRIVWASVIWANHKIFEQGQDSCAGEIIFDPKGRTSLEELRAYGEALHSLKGVTPREPDQLVYARHLTQENSRVFGMPYPKSLGDVDLLVSSVWFYRRHLPNGMLSDTVFPIIISEHTKGRVMVLPSRLWEPKFYQAWLQRAKNKFGETYDLLPQIEEQERYSSYILGQGRETHIFPKYHEIFGD